MANLEERTRKRQVLDYLIRRRNHWVDGPEIANEEVGGSEGLRRLRELIQEGYPIQARRHPSPARSIWQYKYDTGMDVSPLRQPSVSEAVQRRDDGSFVYVPDQATVEPTQMVNEPSVSLYKYEHLPSRVDFGSTAICPRCHGKTQKYRFAKVDGLRHKDPVKEKTPCIGCNGWGMVPNVGPIP